MSPKHVVSCSFGKDSIATILLALEHGEPLDEAVYCEVMFDNSTSGEVPEHQAFIYQAAIPALEKLGVPVRVLRSEKTYTSVFMGKVTRGPKKGMIRSFPVCGKCYVQRDCKMPDPAVSENTAVRYRAVHWHCKGRTAASGTARRQSGVAAGEIRIHRG